VYHRDQLKIFTRTHSSHVWTFTYGTNDRLFCAAVRLALRVCIFLLHED